MSILIRRCLGRSRYVQELVENWQIEHKQAMFACDVQELLAECLDLAHLCKQAWQSLIERLFAEQVDNVEEAGKMMKMAISKALSACGRMEEAVVLAERMGYAIDNAVSFRSVVRELQDVEADVKNRWPAVNPVLVEESLAAYHRGEYRTTEELLSEAQSSCSWAN